MKLMNRFYDTSNGEFLIDGKNVKEYDVESVRAMNSTDTISSDGMTNLANTTITMIFSLPWTAPTSGRQSVSNWLKS
jgi:ABC-type transport system involved in Fe-S cluster assembly fused permease/ATPase subunit